MLAEAGFDPALVQLAAEADGQGLAKTLAERDEVAIIDYTGGPTFGAWLEESAAAHGKLVYTEKAGLNTIVVDSTDNLKGMLGNLAFCLTLYSGQMCTAPQNLYVPEGGIDTDEGHLSFDEFGERLAGAVGRLTGDDAKAVELLGATVNDQVRDNADSLASIADGCRGRVVLDSRRVDAPGVGRRRRARPGSGRRGRRARGRLHAGVLRARSASSSDRLDGPVARPARRHRARARRA